MEDFKEWLEEMLIEAEEEVGYNTGSPNSYGAGYDLGTLDAFKAAKKKITDIENGVED